MRICREVVGAESESRQGEVITKRNQGGNRTVLEVGSVKRGFYGRGRMQVNWMRESAGRSWRNVKGRRMETR
ncbi:hypothetical protein E2C01_003999 [Portunus trituberculatus]|uniref:Uncharacterized protein n=1 Tax=Portunus trituberculatus TaxID=210409 RepID=A0A5B7CSN0_PORTR|nr:hypothetical protein [Portunus trituberculatus]